MEKRKACTTEFRREAVRLSYDSCLTVEAVANDPGIGKSTLTTWRRQLRDAPVDERMSDPNEDELTRLRRAVKILRQERDRFCGELFILNVFRFDL